MSSSPERVRDSFLEDEGPTSGITQIQRKHVQIDGMDFEFDFSLCHGPYLC